jgi:hypothetical protein
VQVVGGPAAHVPAWHVSPFVHAFPSEHDVPLGAVGVEQAPLNGLQVPATWQESAALQVTGSEPVQVPAWQLSLCVQALPSEHVVPLGAVGLEQAPVAASHTPPMWQASAAVQTTGVVPTQIPVEQASTVVHALPSEQVVPWGASGFEQAPVEGLHVPALWHASEAAHTTGSAPTQTPAWQLSAWVHALPSLQVVPFATGVWEQVPSGLAVSVVHAFPSSQFGGGGGGALDEV